LLGAARHFETGPFQLGAGTDLLKGYVNLNIAAGCGRIDRFNDALNVGAKSRPLLLAENHNRDRTDRKVLLITHVLVRCQQDVKSRLFRYGQLQCERYGRRDTNGSARALPDRK
jgi:hypothetical protein